MVQIEDTIEICAPIEIAFDAGRNVSLHEETQITRGERAVGGKTSGLVELGDEIEWEATHFYLRQRLRVRITQMEKPVFFRDEMISGAFKSMTHDHFFKSIGPSKTMLKDVFCFTAPLGPLGYVAEKLFLTSYMSRFLRAKNRELKRLVELQFSSLSQK